MHDMWTVVWKEWREFRDQLLSLRRGGLSALILALILGIVAPVQLGPEWVQSKLIVAYWPFLAATMVSSLIADSVAGERERHTLETLLASRLSDSAILIGKIVAAVLYGLGFALANLLVGLIAVNIAHREVGPILFGTQRFIVTIVLTILASLFMAGIGVFISLRASTVKQAQQAFGIAIIVLTMTNGQWNTMVLANLMFDWMFRGGGDSGRSAVIALIIMAAVTPIMVWNIRQANREMEGR